MPTSPRRDQRSFLLLILAQAAHSIEEYIAKRLDHVFAPARLVSGLVSDDLAFGFAVPNAAIVTIVFWCWAVPRARPAPLTQR